MISDRKLLAGIAQKIFGQWSRHFVEQKKFSEAVGVYTQGLQRFPNDEHLTHNAMVTWDQWAAVHIEKKQWSEAIGVYENGLKVFPNASLLKNNLAYCKQQQTR